MPDGAWVNSATIMSALTPGFQQIISLLRSDRHLNGSQVINAMPPTTVRASQSHSDCSGDNSDDSATSPQAHRRGHGQSLTEKRHAKKSRIVKRKTARKPTVMTATRPMERQPMRDWLREQIDSRLYPGLEWIEQDVVKIPWKHAARHGWSINEDASLFESYAKHTGIYKTQDPMGDHKKWKANFRCAINSLPELLEVTEDFGGSKKGSGAYKAYRFLTTQETQRRKYEKKSKSAQKQRMAAESLDAMESDTDESSLEYLSRKGQQQHSSLPAVLESYTGGASHSPSPGPGAGVVEPYTGGASHSPSPGVGAASIGGSSGPFSPYSCSGPLSPANSNYSGSSGMCSPRSIGLLGPQEMNLAQLGLHQVGKEMSPPIGLDLGRSYCGDPENLGQQMTSHSSDFSETLSCDDKEAIELANEMHQDYNIRSLSSYDGSDYMGCAEDEGNGENSMDQQIHSLQPAALEQHCERWQMTTEGDGSTFMVNSNGTGTTINTDTSQGYNATNQPVESMEEEEGTVSLTQITATCNVYPQPHTCTAINNTNTAIVRHVIIPKPNLSINVELK